MDDVRGQRVLDLGCGTGDLALRLIARNAAVTGLDLSPGMVAVARERVDLHLPGAAAEFLSAPAEATGLESEGFDWVVGKWVLHHLDLEAAAAEIHRLLRPGGKGVFVETSALNPLLVFARGRLAGRHGVARLGTEDEHPLDERDIKRFGSRFADTRLDFPNFLLFELLDRHVVSWRWERLTRGLKRLDRFAERRPRLGRFSYYLRVRVRK